MAFHTRILHTIIYFKHFRNLEERKKQHKEGPYMSDTLPRKKTAPPISPHFSSSTLGRNVKVSNCTAQINKFDFRAPC